MKDITKKWTNNRGSIVPKVEDLTDFIINNVNYKVSGTDVRFEYDEEEKAIAILLSKVSGKKIYMLPKINKPDGIPTADYLIEGEKYDLKIPIGSGKNTIYDLVRKSKAQADNFIICLDNTVLGIDDVDLQIKTIYSSKHTQSINKIILIKNGEILKVFKR